MTPVTSISLSIAQRLQLIVNHLQPSLDIFHYAVDAAHHNKSDDHDRPKYPVAHSHSPCVVEGRNLAPIQPSPHSPHSNLRRQAGGALSVKVAELGGKSPSKATIC